MFCSFDRRPTIVRLHGTGRAVLADDPGFDAELAGFGEAGASRRPYLRGVIVVDVARVADSCGYAVPRMELVEERETLDRVWRTRDDERIATYHAEQNATSLDGLPGLDGCRSARRPSGRLRQPRARPPIRRCPPAVPCDHRPRGGGAGMTRRGPRPPRPLRVHEVLALSLTRRRRGSGFWFGFAISALWPFTMFGARVAFGGGEHLPRSGGALLACNHVSDVDPIYDVAFTISHGRMPRFLAKAELWRIPVVRSVMAGGRHIPVQRASTRAADAYKEAIEALRRGEVVVFYPEGTFTADPDGWPMKAKNGIGRIALVTGAPVIPVANWGTQNLVPPDRRPPPVPPQDGAGRRRAAGGPVALAGRAAHPHRAERRHGRDHVRHHGAGGRAARGGPAAGAVRPGPPPAVRRAAG